MKTSALRRWLREERARDNLYAYEAQRWPMDWPADAVTVKVSLYIEPIEVSAMYERIDAMYRAALAGLWG